jgi:two-component system nitrogen regulation response regulator GlnG
MCARSGSSTDGRRAGRCAALVACSFAAAFVVGLAMPRLLDGWNSRAVDQLFRVRYRLQGKAAVSPYLVHVVVTDGIPAGLERAAVGRALQILDRMDVRMVACDIAFPQAGAPENDAPLLEAARRSDRIVFPVLAVPGGPPAPDAELLERCTIRPRVAGEGSPPGAGSLILPFAELAGASRAMGHINYEPDSDGLVRRIPLLYRSGDAFVPALSLRTLIGFLGVDPTSIEVSFGRRILLPGARVGDGMRKDISIPIDREGRLIVNPVGPWADSFLTVPLQKLFDADQAAESRSRLRDLLEGSLVVLSDVSTTGQDYGRGVFESVYPLSGVHLSVTNSVLTGNFLAPQGAWASILAGLVFAAVLWLAASRFATAASSALMVAGYALFLGWCYWLFAGAHRVPQMGIPTLGFALSLASVAVYRIALAEQDRSTAHAKLEASRALEALNARLVEQKRELEAANEQLKALGQARAALAQNVVRELRGSLQQVTDPLEDLAGRAADGSVPPPAVERIEEARGAARKLLEVVGRLLVPGRAEAGAGVASPGRGGRAGQSVLLAVGAAEAPAYASVLRGAGFADVTTCSDGARVLPLLRATPVGAVVLDLELPGSSGTALLAQIREGVPEVEVLVVTGLQDIDIAVECLRLGASDYLVKPPEPARLVQAVDRCVEKRALEHELSALSRRLQSVELRNPEAFSEIVTASRLMASRFRLVEAIAGDGEPVLITGESGVGKELVARAIHRLSGRQGPFVSENIAGLDDTMFADTLFGHRKGAFTDAEGARRGLVEEAKGGTLFLDEIGDLSAASQVKLLRFIEEREFRSLGSDRVTVSDARIVLATNVDLAARMQEGRFREDLFYRLTHRIDIPPLRERMEDLPLLLDHFVREAAAARGREQPAIPKELLPLLRTYAFPGNIRELKNMVDGALSRGDSSTLSVSHFKDYIRTGSARPGGDAGAGSAAAEVTGGGEVRTLKETEQRLIEEALERTGGNQNLAARLLGLSPSALSRRLRKRGVRS